MGFLYQGYNCLTDNVLGRYTKLKADEKLISPVCSESVESLLQIYGFFLKMQIYSSMNSSRSFIRAGILRSEGGGEFATRCIILIFGEFDNFLRKIDNGMFGKNTELCTS